MSAVVTVDDDFVHIDDGRNGDHLIAMRLLGCFHLVLHHGPIVQIRSELTGTSLMDERPVRV